MTNVILCGGTGTRLWPLSRKLMPKQFLKLFNNKSLFQMTFERNKDLINRFLIISNVEQYFIALDQLEEIDEDNIPFLLEEVGKNTAPAITFAAFEANRDEILFVTPSDHLIKDKQLYQKAINQAKKFAEDGYIVTFGITPSTPETGYGYIEANGFNVIKFHEKPNSEQAKEYLNKGGFSWNSGIFMFKVGIFLDELQKHAPTIYNECKNIYQNSIKNINSFQKRVTNMQNITDMSIDYALMEKSSKLKVIPSDFQWSDLGSFDSLTKEIKSSNVIEIKSKNNFYYSKKTIATIGIEDIIIVDTPDALLISKKGQTQKVKEVVNILKKRDKKLIETHTVVHRPWGSYEVLQEGNGYKIKKIIVKPGKKLSLQKHFHRNEHWIVVSGTATVIVENKTYLVRPNESTYIKMGEIHRLSNKGKIPVILIEAQVGEYTNEDDIVRIKDDYNRDINNDKENK